jgi:hypothetical protein
MFGKRINEHLKKDYLEGREFNLFVRLKKSIKEVK